MQDNLSDRDEARTRTYRLVLRLETYCRSFGYHYTVYFKNIHLYVIVYN